MKSLLAYFCAAYLDWRVKRRSLALLRDQFRLDRLNASWAALSLYRPDPEALAFVMHRCLVQERRRERADRIERTRVAVDSYREAAQHLALTISGAAISLGYLSGSFTAALEPEVQL